MHISFLKKIVCLFVIMVFVEGRSASKIDEYYKLPPYSFQIAVLKYNGGGDWYANLETSVTNLIKYCNDNLKTSINPEQAIVDAGSVEIFNYPFVHMTGHGNVIFTDQEAENLRNYLILKN